MRTNQIDILNIGLIFLSLAVAFFLPFELFLFSYAVLGPLHYLTELNWLKEKNYFVKERSWVWVFVALTLVMSIPRLLSLPLFTNYSELESIKTVSKGITGVTNEMILISFLFAVGLVYLRQRYYVLLSLFASVVAGTLILAFVPFSIIMVGVFLPTIIHVYLFTLLFMVFGALNTKSNAGMAGGVLLLMCPLIIFAAKINPSSYVVSEYTTTTFLASSFSIVSSHMASILGTLEDGQFHLFSQSGIKIQIFIAFCYTYHFLNWFSKTSVIGWSKALSRSKLAAISFVWIGSIFLYWYDYKTGFTALFFLSMIHVVLEFPLNVTSIKGIVSKIGPHPSRSQEQVSRPGKSPKQLR